MVYELDGDDSLAYVLSPFGRAIFENIHNSKILYKQWMVDKDVTRYNSHGLFRKSENDIALWLDDIDSGKIICWALWAKSKTDGEMKWLGVISLQSINWVYRSTEVALYIGDKNYWGKGLATFMVECVCNHAFMKMNMNRVWSGTAAINAGMRRVFEKIGFVNEGKFRDGMFIDGKYCDIACYSYLRKDYDDQFNSYTDDK